MTVFHPRGKEGFMSRSRVVAALTALFTLFALSGLPAIADAAGVEITCGRGQRAFVRQVGSGYQVECAYDSYARSTAVPRYISADDGVYAPQRVVYVPQYRTRTRYVYVERPQRSRKKSALIIGGSAVGGAGVGALVGGRRGAKRGALVGGIGGVVYDLATRNR
jgi:hypothetical protein